MGKTKEGKVAAGKGGTAEKNRVRAIFTTLRAANPNPTTELKSENPFQLLVAVVLSAQATDKGVNKATESLFKTVKTPQQMVALGEEGLTPYVKSIGLYRGKVKNVIALSKLLVANHNSQVPSTHGELVSLPGVGNKTANVILNTVFGQPTMAVDTHVFRVAHRLGLSKGKTPEAVERDLLRVIPGEFLQNAHHWLILHGRYVCVARSPKCSVCPVEKYCPFLQKTYS